MDSYQYGGKWILIHAEEEGINLFHDLVGARQVYYTNYQGHTWCASQPHVLAALCNLDKDNSKDINDFINAKAFVNSECAWIGNKTRYKGVFHLLPNKYLSLDKCKIKRYWPSKLIEKTSLDKAAAQVSETLKGVIKSANHRFDLSLAISAGWDSRVLLAASKEQIDDFYCFVQQYNGMSDAHVDIRIPNKLTKTLGFLLTFIKSKIMMMIWIEL